jgi:hypothetical protein
MGNPEITQLGLGGMIVWLTMKEMFGFLKSKKIDNSEDVILERVLSSIEKIAENTTRQTELMGQMQSRCGNVHESQIRIETKLNGKS